MRGADVTQEGLFITRKTADYVPAGHPLIAIREILNRALRDMDLLRSDGVVSGALLLNTRTGRLIAVRSRATEARARPARRARPAHRARAVPRVAPATASRRALKARWGLEELGLAHECVER